MTHKISARVWSELIKFVSDKQYTTNDYKPFLADMEKNGLTKDEAYRLWRRLWHEHDGRSWRDRRKGVKGKGRHYGDASTATEATAS